MSFSSHCACSDWRTLILIVATAKSVSHEIFIFSVGDFATISSLESFVIGVGDSLIMSCSSSLLWILNCTTIFSSFFRSLTKPRVPKIYTSLFLIFINATSNCRGMQNYFHFASTLFFLFLKTDSWKNCCFNNTDKILVYNIAASVIKIPANKSKWIPHNT
jgi:hypothetical protein